MNKQTTKIGMLGGGQLGRMFIQNALNFPVETHVLDPASKAPCAGIAHSHTTGSFNNYEDVLKFGQTNDVLTIEIEHVNTKALRKLEDQGKTVVPSAKTIEIIKDKGLQKQFYAKQAIPTSEFRLIENKAELNKHKDFLPFFQKARTGGYDGKGVIEIKSTADFEKAFDCPSVLEKAVSIEMELSVIVVKNTDGQTVAFPVVEQVFDPIYNLVDYLVSPARISKEQAELAVSLAKQVADGLNSPGIFAVELFLSTEGEILVNETAPRTHNSGHHTIESANYSQFDMHLRAVMNYPLVEPKLKQIGAMVNLIGAEGYTGKVFYSGLNSLLTMPNVYIHIYGKEETRPGRKMGHITVLGDDYFEIEEKIAKIKDLCRVESQA